MRRRQGLDPRGREVLALGGERAEGALLFSWAEIAVIDQAISRLSRRENGAWQGRYLVNYPLDAKDLAFETQELWGRRKFSWLLVKSHQILSYVHTFCDFPQGSCGILIGSDIAAKALSARLISGLATIHPRHSTKRDTQRVHWSRRHRRQKGRKEMSLPQVMRWQSYGREAVAGEGITVDGDFLPCGVRPAPSFNSPKPRDVANNGRVDDIRYLNLHPPPQSHIHSRSLSCFPSCGLPLYDVEPPRSVLDRPPSCIGKA